jgi:hypothetical protein
LGLRDEIDSIYARLVELLRGASAAKGASRSGKKSKGGTGLEGMESLRAAHLLLHVAGGWFHLGQRDQALRITSDVRLRLLEGELAPQDRKNLACTYVAAVGAAEPETAWPLLAELFQRRGPGSAERNLPGISDTFVTATHFSLSQLNVVEAAVLALTDADSALSPGARRWLEEDEYYVRRRVHRDVRACL